MKVPVQTANRVNTLNAKCAVKDLERIVTMADRFVLLAGHFSADLCRWGTMRSSDAEEEKEAV